MKKFLVFVGGFMLYAGVSHGAAALVAETPILGYGTPVTIAISSTTLTKVPSSQTSGRIGVFLNVPFDNTGRMVGFLGDCTSTSLARTIQPIAIIPATNTSYIPLREDVCLWLTTTNVAASTENLHYQEVKQ